MAAPLVPGLGRAAWGRAAGVDGRGAAVAALGMLLVLPLGLSDGGYYGRSLMALTLALATGAALALLRPLDLRRPSRALTAAAFALALLSAWVALSALWAEPGAGVGLETRRCVLYAVALFAVGVVTAGRRRTFLLALTSAVSTLAAVGIVMRVRSGVPVDPYGSLLAEPVGYPNAMGVLAATAAVLAIGLGDGRGKRAEGGLRALAPFLILVLGSTGSRGGALALGVGLVVLVVLTGQQERWPCMGRAASAIALGAGLWAVIVASGGGVVPTMIATVAVAALGAALPTPGRRAACALACGLAIAGASAVAVHPPPTTSSFRSAYWKAALTEVRERPFLGSGAGSFYLTWCEHRAVDTEVRDAHSLYVETLSELGPVGLVLVLVLIVLPLAVAVGRRGDAVGAAAAAGLAVFAVHAGLDWDWEMPAVTLVALGCGGIVLAAGEQTSVRRTR